MTRERESRRKLWHLHTETVLENEIPVLFVTGRLGHAAAAELERVVARHAMDASANVTIDLSGVDYLSSAALKVFESLAVRQSEGGGALRLREPSVTARLALELSGLLTLVDSPLPDHD